MNWDIAKGNWTLFKGNVKLQWGNLTHDHLSKIAGRHDQFTGKMQKAYGTTKQVTEAQVRNLRQVKEFVGSHRDNVHRI